MPPPPHPADVDAAAAASSRPRLTLPLPHSLPPIACSSRTLLPPTEVVGARVRRDLDQGASRPVPFLLRRRRGEQQQERLSPPSSPPFLLSWGKGFLACDEAAVEAPAWRWCRCPSHLIADAPPLDAGANDVQCK